MNDFLTFEEVAMELGEDQARRLAQHTPLIAWDGTPCWEAARLAELLALLVWEDHLR